MAEPGDRDWLAAETTRLLAFGTASQVEHGFAHLDAVRRVEDKPLDLWVTCRMTHVYAIAHLLGWSEGAALTDHGLAALTGAFADREFGGWFAAVDRAGRPADTTKAAYAHAFVILAASSATVAGRPGAAELLEDALRISDEYFWDESAGLVVDEWDREFLVCDDYRGVNAVMHTVEAYLAAADVTGDPLWLDRAVRMTERVVHGFARDHDWLLPEHFDADWNPLPDFNADQPAHPFRPYGATVGHGFEWARLTVHAQASLVRRGDTPAAWLLTDAIALFDRVTAVGWARDGADGPVYTVDWAGQPVVRERMHWVAAEAVAAAAVLHGVTGEQRFADLQRDWWAFIERHHLDRVGGSWWHELGADLTPSATVWGGKSDLYHAVQATLIPRLPAAPALVPALGAGLLDN